MLGQGSAAWVRPIWLESAHDSLHIQKTEHRRLDMYSTGTVQYPTVCTVQHYMYIAIPAGVADKAAVVRQSAAAARLHALVRVTATRATRARARAQAVDYYILDR